ncbi:hypothetical protein GE21DRAFT_1221526 [Neurospora crassa]|nr:hypothetical protein GE21DRAFT_1221526 [Neurospora crassa]
MRAGKVQARGPWVAVPKWAGGRGLSVVLSETHLLPSLDPDQTAPARIHSRVTAALATQSGTWGQPWQAEGSRGCAPGQLKTLELGSRSGNPI